MRIFCVLSTSSNIPGGPMEEEMTAGDSRSSSASGQL